MAIQESSSALAEVSIYKYVLDEPDPLDKVVARRVRMPDGAVPLSVAAQHDKIVMYAQVPIGEVAQRAYWFRICPTGRGFHRWASHRFIGTVLLRGGALVYHVYEIEQAHASAPVASPAAEAP